jgi:hypothetical protein
MARHGDHGLSCLCAVFFSSWFQTYLVKGHGYSEGGLMLLAAVHTRGVRKPGGRCNERSVGKEAGPEGGQADRWRGWAWDRCFVFDCDHPDKSEDAGAGVLVAPVLRADLSATQHWCGLPRHRPETRRGRVRVFQHRRERRPAL